MSQHCSLALFIDTPLIIPSITHRVTTAALTIFVPCETQEAYVLDGPWRRRFRLVITFLQLIAYQRFDHRHYASEAISVTKAILVESTDAYPINTKKRCHEGFDNLASNKHIWLGNKSVGSHKYTTIGISRHMCLATEESQRTNCRSIIDVIYDLQSDDSHCLARATNV